MKKKDKNEKHKQFTITLHPVVYDQIKEFSEKKFLSISASIAQLVMEALNNNKKDI